ncbi:MAG: Hsp20/alpha crystallin family protein [Caldicoprobacterales bacterium]|jgi:HSP20 family protein|nr:Hsp20/alpha crystallin family protein [Clostridiales bacterium]
MRGMIPFRRRNGFAPVDLFRDFFGRDIMDDFFSSSMLPMSMAGSFRADIKENQKEYIVEAELPGYSKEDIEIDLVDDRLTISAQKNEEISEERDNYIRRERRVGKVSRSFLVSGIKNDEVKAEYTDGLLRVILPKDEEGRKRGRRIDIN